MLLLAGNFAIVFNFQKNGEEIINQYCKEISTRKKIQKKLSADGGLYSPENLMAFIITNKIQKKNKKCNQHRTNGVMMH